MNTVGGARGAVEAERLHPLVDGPAFHTAARANGMPHARLRRVLAGAARSDLAQPSATSTARSSTPRTTASARLPSAARTARCRSPIVRT